VPVPEHPSPLQPEKIDPAEGVAVRATVVLKSYDAEHVEPQLMPEGLEDTVPEPEPALLTVSAKVWSVKVAVTLRAADMETVHVPVPAQPAPLQPENVEPEVGVAVSVTDWLESYEAEHVEPQLMPAGLEETVPEPVPALLTVSAKVWSVKVAVTLRAAFMATLHVLVPEQPSPLQPENVEPAVAAAESVTVWVEA